MTVEELGILVLKEAQIQIQYVHDLNPEKGLSWGQTEALSDIRTDLRICLDVVADYAEDFSTKEAVEWIGSKLEWDNNLILDGLWRKYLTD